MKVLIGGNEYGPDIFIERIDIDHALEAVSRACDLAKREFYHLDCFWKQWRDAEVMLKMLKGECYECDKKARWLYVNQEKDFAYLRCDDHKPMYNDEYLKNFFVVHLEE